MGINAPPVTIKSVECAIVDKGFEMGWIVPEPPDKRTGKKVTVVGSGPAGLACAAQLNRAGHWVTVYERGRSHRRSANVRDPQHEARQEKAVQRRVDLMEAEGVKFVTRTEIGVDLPATQLVKENDSVVLCGGATKPNDLPIEGRDLPGIYFAMDFLRANTKSLLDSNHADGNYISAKDQHVIVIGGGDTGTDCVGTSMPPRMQDALAIRDHAPATGRASAQQPLAAVAQRL